MRDEVNSSRSEISRRCDIYHVCVYTNIN